MSYNSDPNSFFGPGYTFASSAITIKCAAAAGVTVGTTVTAEADDDVFTTASAHGLKTGDRVRFTEVGTLPTGVSAGTDYWVKTVPSNVTFTISASKGGATLNVTADGSAGNNTVQAMGPLDEISDAEGAASGGTSDWRKVVFGIMECIYQKWINTPSADRPAKINVSRSSSVNETTGEITRFYSVSCTTNPTGVEVVDE